MRCRGVLWSPRHLGIRSGKRAWVLRHSRRLRCCRVCHAAGLRRAGHLRILRSGRIRSRWIRAGISGRCGGRRRRETSLILRGHRKLRRARHRSAGELRRGRVLGSGRVLWSRRVRYVSERGLRVSLRCRALRIGHRRILPTCLWRLRILRHRAGHGLSRHLWVLRRILLSGNRLTSAGRNASLRKGTLRRRKRGHGRQFTRRAWHAARIWSRHATHFPRLAEAQRRHDCRTRIIRRSPTCSRRNFSPLSPLLFLVSNLPVPCRCGKETRGHVSFYDDRTGCRARPTAPPAVAKTLLKGSTTAGRCVILRFSHDAGWSSPVAREAHNLEVAGSNPVPAT